MNSTALAVIIIIFAAFVLVTMAGVSGFTFGRARATDNAAKKTIKKDERLHEALLDLKADTILLSDILLFTQSRSFDYRQIALEAIEIMSTDDPRKENLERKLQDIDGKVQKKVTEIESKKG